MFACERDYNYIAGVKIYLQRLHTPEPKLPNQQPAVMPI